MAEQPAAQAQRLPVEAGRRVQCACGVRAVCVQCARCVCGACGVYAVCVRYVCGMRAVSVRCACGVRAYGRRVQCASSACGMRAVCVRCACVHVCTCQLRLRALAESMKTKLRTPRPASDASQETVSGMMYTSPRRRRSLRTIGSVRSAGYSAARRGLTGRSERYVELGQRLLRLSASWTSASGPPVSMWW